MPDLTRDEIVDHLRRILGDESVVTDEEVLRRSSIDNFRKLQKIFDVYTMPMPAAVAVVRSTEEVARILAFADENKVNIVARTGGTATEGGSIPRWASRALATTLPYPGYSRAGDGR